MDQVLAKRTNSGSGSGDLASCEKEPLQFIGSVQSFGGLIGFTLKDLRIQMASENIEEFTETRHQQVVSSKLDHVFGPETARKITQAATDISGAAHRLTLSLDINSRRFDSTIYFSDGLYFLEIEPHGPHEVALGDYLLQEDLLRAYTVELRNKQDIVGQAQILCRTVQRLTGMDRVMLYRFLAPENHGIVIAEHRVLTAHSYLHHRFPASDIPKIARDLYLRNNVRLISDVDAPTARVLPGVHPSSGHQVDLSDSRLRAVSPIHLEYLRNMKVRCSFSVAVIVDNQLWGLIACHHLKPLHLSVSKRTACELVANMFAGQAGLVERAEKQRERLEFSEQFRALTNQVVTSRDTLGELMRRHQHLLTMFHATGIALVREDRSDLAGLCPLRQDVQKIASRISHAMTEKKTERMAIESLTEAFPELPNVPHIACGVLAIKADEQTLLLLFRPEQIETIIWGGDPRKQLERKTFEGRINPRASFDTWEETVHGHSAVWSDVEIDGIESLRSTFFEKLRHLAST